MRNKAIYILSVLFLISTATTILSLAGYADARRRVIVLSDGLWETYPDLMHNDVVDEISLAIYLKGIVVTIDVFRRVITILLVSTCLAFSVLIAFRLRACWAKK